MYAYLYGMFLVLVGITLGLIARRWMIRRVEAAEIESERLRLTRQNTEILFGVLISAILIYLVMR